MPEPKQGPASAAPAAESLSAILAEFRAFALRAAGEGRTICPESVLLLADKAEAAAERERVEREFAHKKVEEALSDEISIRDEKIKRSAPGNAAALREALELCNELFRCDDDNKSRLCNLARKADEATRTALATPARNCDRFKTLDEAREAFQDLRGHKILADVELWGSMDEAGALVRWLFAPAQGKEADHAD